MSMESKIKEANALIKEVHIFPMSKLFGRKQVIDLMKAAQKQAIEAALEAVKQRAYGLYYEDAFDRNPSFVDVCEKCVSDLINSPELKVI